MLYDKYVVVGADTCANCTTAKNVLIAQDLEWSYLDMFRDKDLEDIQNLLLVTKTMSLRSIPQLFGYKGSEPTYIGGFTEFQEHMRDATS
jgi:glutaredoxin